MARNRTVWTMRVDGKDSRDGTCRMNSLCTYVWSVIRNLPSILSMLSTTPPKCDPKRPRTAADLTAHSLRLSIVAEWRNALRRTGEEAAE